MRQVIVTLSQLEAGELQPLVDAMLAARAELTRCERNISIATGMLFANRRIPPEGAAFVQLEGNAMLVQLPDSAQLEALHTTPLESPRAAADLGAAHAHPEYGGVRNFAERPPLPVDVNVEQHNARARAKNNGANGAGTPELLP